MKRILRSRVIELDENRKSVNTSKNNNNNNKNKNSKNNSNNNSKYNNNYESPQKEDVKKRKGRGNGKENKVKKREEVESNSDVALSEEKMIMDNLKLPEIPEIPADILGVIFSFMHPSDIVFTAPLICKSAHKKLQEPEFYQFMMLRDVPWISEPNKILSFTPKFWKSLFMVLNKKRIVPPVHFAVEKLLNFKEGKDTSKNNLAKVRMMIKCVEDGDLTLPITYQSPKNTGDPILQFLNGLKISNQIKENTDITESDSDCSNGINVDIYTTKFSMINTAGDIISFVVEGRSKREELEHNIVIGINGAAKEGCDKRDIFPYLGLPEKYYPTFKQFWIKHFRDDCDQNFFWKKNKTSWGDIDEAKDGNNSAEDDDGDTCKSENSSD